MEKKSSSLLAQIKSKYILKQILSLAFGEMKPVIKLVKYNKSLLNKLDIDIKENFKYKIETKIEIKGSIPFIYLFTMVSLFSFLFLTYIIKFYVSGKFNDKNLKDGYNMKKKKFVDFMDNSILFAYFGFLITSIIFLIVYFCCNSFALKKQAKLIIFTLIFLVDLAHYITYIIKLDFTIKIIRKELFRKCSFFNSCDSSEREEEQKNLEIIWFYEFDICIIIFLSLHILIWFILLLASSSYEREDIKKFFINQFNGIKICSFELPNSFINLSDKEKNEIIFKKENF